MREPLQPPPPPPPMLTPPPTHGSDADASAAAPWVVPPESSGPGPGIVWAPHGRRLVAYLIDATLLVLVLVGFIVPVALLPPGELPAPAGVAIVVLVFVIEFGAFPWFWVHGGQTPGMRLFGLTVVRDRDGGPIGWGTALLRMLGLFFVSPAVFYIGFAWVLIDDRRRAWHDLIAGTVVVGRGPG